MGGESTLDVSVFWEGEVIEQEAECVACGVDPGGEVVHGFGADFEEGEVVFAGLQFV